MPTFTLAEWLAKEASLRAAQAAIPTPPMDATKVMADYLAMIEESSRVPDYLAMILGSVLDSCPIPYLRRITEAMACTYPYSRMALERVAGENESPSSPVLMLKA